MSKDKDIENEPFKPTYEALMKRCVNELNEVVQKFEHKYEHPQLTVKVNKEDIPSVLSKVLPELDYVDITVENETIEEVIKRSFAR